MIQKLKKIYYYTKETKHDSFLSMHIYMILRTIKKHPILWFFKYVINVSYSFFISYKLHGFTLIPKVIFDVNIFKVKVVKSKKSYIHSKSKFSFIFQSYLGSETVASINLSNDSILNIDNVFYLGNGVKIVVYKNATLNIKGSKQSISGITCDSSIFAFKNIYIGEDSIFSWGVYISDSSQHKINGQIKISDIKIGEHTWVSENVTIGPGTIIGNDCIIGSKSFLNGKEYSNNVLIVGQPAVIKKTNITWSR